MTAEKSWAKRVAAWRASGKTSTAFAEGQDFTAGGLRYWAHRIDRARRVSQAEPAPKPAPVRVRRRAVRIAKVIRGSPGAPPVSASADGSIVFDYAGTRVAVRADYDRAALRDLLALFGEMGDVIAARRRR